MAGGLSLQIILLLNRSISLANTVPGHHQLFLAWVPMATSSQESTASECSETEFNDSKINFTTAAVVTWEGQYAEIDLHLQYDASTTTAFFKLRTSLVLKALSPNRTYLYLFIAPEAIKTLTLDESRLPDQSSDSVDAARILGSTFNRLYFSLSRSADLIGPSFVGLTPKNKSEGRVIDQLRSLAQATEFTVSISHQVISKSKLLSLCQQIKDVLLKSGPGQTDLSCLYEGKGGKQIPAGRPEKLSTDPEHGHQPSGEAPPSYTVAAICPSGPANKKRRRDSPAVVELGTDLLQTMEKMCRKMVREQVSEQIQHLEARLTDKIERLVEKHVERQGDQITDDIQQVRDEVDEKIEDEFYGLRVRLEEYVNDELKEAEERIVEHLQSTASVHLEFSS